MSISVEQSNSSIVRLWGIYLISSSSSTAIFFLFNLNFFSRDNFYVCVRRSVKYQISITAHTWHFLTKQKSQKDNWISITDFCLPKNHNQSVIFVTTAPRILSQITFNIATTTTIWYCINKWQHQFIMFTSSRTLERDLLKWLLLNSKSFGNS